METIITGERTEASVVEPKVVPYVGKQEGSFLDILFDINRAVEVFIYRYESHHDVRILDLSLEKEAVVGSYFISGVIKLNFTFRRNEDRQPFCSSAIMKVPQLGMFRTDGEDLLLYPKERFAYEEVIPRMYASWRGRKAVPEFYGSTDSYIIVLENLSQIGFYQYPHGLLLDLSSGMVVLKALAQFHALSLVHIDRFRTSLESLTLQSKTSCEFVKHVYPQMVDKLRRHVFPSCSQLARETFEEYWKNLPHVDKLVQSPNQDSFNVIMHGDLHHYNLLLKNDDRNKVTECKLIDFQHVRCGPPILDLMKFLVTSVEFEVFEKNHVQLFNCYLKELDEVLKKLGVSKPRPYGLKEIKVDLEKYKFGFLFDLTCLLPLFLAGRRTDFDTLGEENEVDKMMASSRYISIFKGWSKFLLVTENV